MSKLIPSNNISKSQSAKSTGARATIIRMRIGDYNKMSNEGKIEFEEFFELLKRVPLTVEDKAMEWDTESKKWTLAAPDSRPSLKLAGQRAKVTNLLKKWGFTTADDVMYASEFVRAYSTELQELASQNFSIKPKWLSFMFCRTLFMALEFDVILELAERRNSLTLSLFEYLDKLFGWTAGNTWQAMVGPKKTRPAISMLFLQRWDEIKGFFQEAGKVLNANTRCNLSLSESRTNIDHDIIFGSYWINYEKMLQSVTIRRFGLTPDQADKIKKTSITNIFAVFRLSKDLPAKINFKVKKTTDNGTKYGAPKDENWFQELKNMEKFLNALNDIAKRAAINENLLKVVDNNKIRDYTKYQNV